MNGPKSKPEAKTDKYCIVCEQWYVIFQGEQYCVSNTWIWVCHGCQISAVTKEVEKILDVASHKLNFQ